MILLKNKRFISFILLSAFTLVFAHSVIPHHHQDEASAHHDASQHDNHDEHEDTDQNFLAQAFSHFQHEGSDVVYETASDYSKSNLDNGSFFLIQHVAEVIDKPPP